MRKSVPLNRLNLNAFISCCVLGSPVLPGFPEMDAIAAQLRAGDTRRAGIQSLQAILHLRSGSLRVERRGRRSDAIQARQFSVLRHLKGV